MKFQIVNPVAEKVQEKASLAPRLKSLEGKSIGLYWNFKGGGDSALKRTGELLRAKFPGVTAKIYTGSIGGSNHFVTREDAKRIAQECAGMVGSTAD